VRTFETVYWGIGILIGIAVVALAPLIVKYWINTILDIFERASFSVSAAK